MSEMADLWREAFATWPTIFRRKGVLTPVGGEAIPFSDFVMTKSILVLERPTPDNVGARRVAVPFERIHNLKYTEPLKTDQFLKAGFVKEMELPTEPVQTLAPAAVTPIAPPPVQPAAAPQPAAILPPQQVAPVVAPAPVQPAAVPQMPSAVPPTAAPASPVQDPTLEQIQAAMLQRQQSEQQQMHQQS